jgi:formate dehydrogenase subunit delta
MTDRAAKLTRMANQIADFYRPYPVDERVAGVARHIKAFWPRQMIRDFQAHIAAGGTGVDPVVITAMASGFGAESTGSAA